MRAGFWYLDSKRQPDSCLQPKAAFCEWNSRWAEQAHRESPMAIKGSKNSQKRTEGNIKFGWNLQFYNQSKISGMRAGFWYLDSKRQPDSCLQPKACFAGGTCIVLYRTMWKVAWPCFGFCFLPRTHFLVFIYWLIYNLSYNIIVTNCRHVSIWF